jgi:DNA-binding transcriptional LysR family regulator
VVRPQHPLATNKLTTKAYAEAAHVHVSPRREAESIVDRGLAAVGHTRRVAVEVPYFALLPDLLVRSDLVATVPERIARHFGEEYGFVVREVPVPLSGFDVCVAWHPTFAADPALVWLREAVARVVGAGRVEHSRP